MEHISTGAGRRRWWTFGPVLLVLAASAASAAGSAGSAPTTGGPDLTVSQSFAPVPTIPEDTVDSITVRNIGDSAATPVMVVQYVSGAVGAAFGAGASTSNCAAMPAVAPYGAIVACQIPGGLAPHSTATVQINDVGQVGSSFTSLATVGTFIDTDINTANNTSTAQGWFGAYADLAVIGTATTGPAVGTASESYVVTNRADARATGLHLSMMITGTGIHGFTPVIPAGSSCATVKPPAGVTIELSCKRTGLAVGASWAIAYTVGATSGTTLTTSTTVSETSPGDPNPVNNSVTKTVTIP